jgi:quercetin dioxygenase-like cupin family protein
MESIFPQPITDLPEADISLKGVKAYLIQDKDHQIIFMEFTKNVDLPEHSHESQWEIVLEGRVDLSVEGSKNTYYKGDRFFIAKGARHSARIYAGYSSIAFFNQKDRYRKKK